MQTLKKILDDSKQGVIYFSMGSNLKSRDLPENMKRELLKMFGMLEQTVLWKLEEDVEDVPANVHILEWTPQESILGTERLFLQIFIYKESDDDVSLFLFGFRLNLIKMYVLY